MSKTKGALAQQALQDIGFGRQVDANTLLTAVEQLERMVGDWANGNVFVSYNFTDPTLPGDDSGVSSFNNDAVISNLSVRLGHVFDVVLTPYQVNSARASYTRLMNKRPPEYASNPYQPIGAGVGRCFSYFFDRVYQEPDDLIKVSAGDTKLAEVGFDGFASAGDIQAITWESASPMVVVSDIETTGNKTKALLTFNGAGEVCVKVRATNTTGESQTAVLSYISTSC